MTETGRTNSDATTAALRSRDLRRQKKAAVGKRPTAATPSAVRRMCTARAWKRNVGCRVTPESHGKNTASLTKAP